MRVSLGEGPGSDRIQVWADGVLVGDVAHEDLAAGYKDYTLNGMSWDCYWNGGSPVTQSRFYDDLMLSTERIGPVRTSLNPVIVKSPFNTDTQGEVQGGWEAEVAQGVQNPLALKQVIDGVATQYEDPEIEYTACLAGRAGGRRGANDRGHYLGQVCRPSGRPDRPGPQHLAFCALAPAR
ncbi:MAG: hypothetical protein A3F83_07065 [Candidatus Glassbacteria bacterium RIFCSPLOWO2_12_FULL_58_11]|uniref:Uncharacterized protein n=1 Tax=Candidatus Glassbacteria bacterium RIFCSPLOWO2_12_FULL_58_11 TaxID=1817867 RepID=A0A1F5YS98_9BACT|nr:MAG: hypothetical protein A3F83_07065 [Candidatus Glassbacteria bacterium RIFCSPLOWO2_12_FULL_58_11]